MKPALKQAPPSSPHEQLAEVLAVVRGHLEAALEQKQRRVPPPIVLAVGSPLARLQERFALSSFEVGIVALAAGIEVRAGFAPLCARVNEDPARAYPTFALALSVLPDGAWQAFAPDAPLRHHRLIQLAEGEVLTERAVRLAEPVLHFLLGVSCLDPRLARRVREIGRDASLPPSHARLAAELGASWARPDGAHVYLLADDVRAGEAIAAELAHAAGRSLCAIEASALPADPGDREELLRLWERDARLADRALLLIADTGGDRGLDRAMLDFTARIAGPILVCGRDAAISSERRVVRLPVEELAFDERLHLWRVALAELPAPGEAELRNLAAHFRLGAPAIANAAEELRLAALRDPELSPAGFLWTASGRLARPRMGELAQRVPARAGLSRLVLPEPQERVLRALLGQVRRKAKVQHDWGFHKSGERGGGTSAVFAGPSGTGKTLAAELLAGELGLDLFRIDLSAVVSKYIGETEQNLRRVFDAAEAGGAVLLFDEADALFGKRTEVKDSHDRHANIEVSYLLQRLEAYGGLALLTTNLRKSIDDAFLRRIQFIVDFPFPEHEMRMRIWEKVFPAEMPTAGVDFAKLARLAVAGGNIRSIARNAAFLAADAEQALGMGHVLEAARMEYGKLGRSLPPDEIRGWL